MAVSTPHRSRLSFLHIAGRRSPNGAASSAHRVEAQASACAFSSAKLRNNLQLTSKTTVFYAKSHARAKIVCILHVPFPSYPSCIRVSFSTESDLPRHAHIHFRKHPIYLRRSIAIFFAVPSPFASPNRHRILRRTVTLSFAEPSASSSTMSFSSFAEHPATLCRRGKRHESHRHADGLHRKDFMQGDTQGLPAKYPNFGYCGDKGFVVTLQAVKLLIHINPFPTATPHKAQGQGETKTNHTQ